MNIELKIINIDKYEVIDNYLVIVNLVQLQVKVTELTTL